MENEQPQLLSDYSDTEKGAYLGAIASIASADREASSQEMEFLKVLSQTANLSEESTQAVLGAAKDPENLSVQKCLDVLKASDLKFPFVTDIMSFAKADGTLSGEEETQIQSMASYLGVNQEQYGVLKEFVHVADESAKKGEVVEPQALSGVQAEEEGGIGGMLKKVGIPSSGLMKGVLAIAAPLLISRILSGGRSSGGMMSGMGGLMGGGLLGGLLGGVMSGGMGGGGLGGIMGGSSSGGLGGLMGGGMSSGGGLGSVLGGLGGLFGGGRSTGGGIMGGGLGSVLGSVLGGGRRGW